MPRANLKRTMTEAPWGWLLEPLYFGRRYLFTYRPWQTDRKAIERIFRKRMGYRPDLSDSKKFNEKLQWLKLHERIDLKVRCSDKILVRDYISETVGPQYVVPLVLTSTSEAVITPEVLPEQPCVIKTNHDQGTVIVVHDKERADFGRIRAKLRVALKTNLYHFAREWPYDRVERKILVEPHLNPESALGLKDFKVFCFNGHPRIIQVDHDRFAEHTRNIYSASWDPLEVTSGYGRGEVEQAPHCLDEMLYIARKLSSPFRFVRVDCYVVNGKPMVGELTFFPTGGFKPFSPDSFDRELGDMLSLSVVNG